MRSYMYIYVRVGIRNKSFLFSRFAIDVRFSDRVRKTQSYRRSRVKRDNVLIVYVRRNRPSVSLLQNHHRVYRFS